jgi:hypothetical protein
MLKSYCDQMHDLILEEGIRKTMGQAHLTPT